MLAGSCIWSAVNKYHNGTAKMAKKAFNMGRSGNQYVAMVTELLSSYWRAHLVESYCKVSNISDTNWLRYLFSSYLNKIWLSVWHHHLDNLYILKIWISLERKEIFDAISSQYHFKVGHFTQLVTDEMYTCQVLPNSHFKMLFSGKTRHLLTDLCLIQLSLNWHLQELLLMNCLSMIWH